jgi:hypothetical protein
VSDKTWKAFERRCARRMGVERIPVTGIDRDGADFENAMFCVQAKLRRGMPGYLRDWLDGICGVAKRSDRIGLVVWREPGRGKTDDDAVVLIKWRDWVALHGEVVEAEEGG